jgi:hypothetical protein
MRACYGAWSARKVARSFPSLLCAGAYSRGERLVPCDGDLEQERFVAPGQVWQHLVEHLQQLTVLA